MRVASEDGLGWGDGSPLLAWTEGGRASVGLGSAWKDLGLIAIGGERCK